MPSSGIDHDDWSVCLSKWMMSVMAMVVLSARSGAHQAAPNATPEAAAAKPAAATAQRGEGKPYEVLASEVWDVPDPVSGRNYQVFVALPAGYADNPDKRYPVLYVTDADYAFPLVWQMARRLNVEGRKIEDFILVGLSYAKGEGGMQSRRRDYTPTTKGPSGSPADAVHGGASDYITYLETQALPFVAKRYRSDESRACSSAIPTVPCCGRRCCWNARNCSAVTSLAARRTGSTSTRWSVDYCGRQARRVPRCGPTFMSASMSRCSMARCRHGGGCAAHDRSAGRAWWPVTGAEAGRAQ